MFSKLEIKASGYGWEKDGCQKGYGGGEQEVKRKKGMKGS